MSQRTPAWSGIQGLVLSCIAMSCNRWFPENDTCISRVIATLWGTHHCHTLGVHLYILVVFATPERTTSPLTTPVLVKESTALQDGQELLWLPLPVLLRWNWQTWILLMSVRNNENACPLLVGLLVSAAIVEKLMEVSSNSLVLCISARSEIVMSKRHPHTPVPLLKVLHTVREERWQFYTVCSQGPSANWAKTGCSFC